ncbi:MAG: FMN-binding protein [Phycisphaerae bacterium]
MRGLAVCAGVVSIVALAIWATGDGALAQGLYRPPAGPPIAPSTTPASAPGSAPVANYKDGAYTGQATGHKSQIEIEITIAAGKIISAKVTKQADDPAWYNRAATAIVPQIVLKQGVQGVNTVTGATRSSRGILNAAKAALAKGSSQPATSAPASPTQTPVHRALPPR